MQDQEPPRPPFEYPGPEWGTVQEFVDATVRHMEYWATRPHAFVPCTGSCPNFPCPYCDLCGRRTASHPIHHVHQHETDINGVSTRGER
jgi:hypothetical protein